MDPELKGYDNNEGYMGLVDGRYVQFASYRDYRDFMEGGD